MIASNLFSASPGQTPTESNPTTYHLENGHVTDSDGTPEFGAPISGVKQAKYEERKLEDLLEESDNSNIND
jgi:hypothetical protein